MSLILGQTVVVSAWATVLRVSSGIMLGGGNRPSPLPFTFPIRKGPLCWVFPRAYRPLTPNAQPVLRRRVSPGWVSMHILSCGCGASVHCFHAGSRLEVLLNLQGSGATTARLGSGAMCTLSPRFHRRSPRFQLPLSLSIVILFMMPWVSATL